MALRTRCNKLRLRPDDEGREDLADWLTWSGVYLTANCWVACGRSLTRIPKSSLTFPSLPIQSFPYQQLVILSIELRGVGEVTNAIYLLHLLLLLFSEGCDGSFVCCLLRGHWYLSTIVTRRFFGKWQFWEIEHFSIEKIPMQCGQQKDWSVILIWGWVGYWRINLKYSSSTTMLFFFLWLYFFGHWIKFKIDHLLLSLILWPFSYRKTISEYLSHIVPKCLDVWQVKGGTSCNEWEKKKNEVYFPPHLICKIPNHSEGPLLCIRIPLKVIWTS